MPGKVMPANRMREIAALILSKGGDARRTARAAAEIADLARSGKPIKVNGHLYTQEELDNYSDRCKKDAEFWKPLIEAAHELQDHSFTMKG